MVEEEEEKENLPISLPEKYGFFEERQERLIKRRRRLEKSSRWWKRWSEAEMADLNLHCEREPQSKKTFYWENDTGRVNFWMFIGSLFVAARNWAVQRGTSHLFAILVVYPFWALLVFIYLFTTPHLMNTLGEMEWLDGILDMLYNWKFFLPNFDPKTFVHLQAEAEKYFTIEGPNTKFPLIFWEPFLGWSWEKASSFITDKPFLFTISAYAYYAFEHLENVNCDWVWIATVLLTLIFSNAIIRFRYFCRFIFKNRQDGVLFAKLPLVNWREWLLYPGAWEDKDLFWDGFEMPAYYSPNYLWYFVGDDEEILEESWHDLALEDDVYSCIEAEGSTLTADYRHLQWDLYPWPDDLWSAWQDLSDDIFQSFTPDTRFLNEELDFWNLIEEADYMYAFERYFFASMKTPWKWNWVKPNYFENLVEKEKEEEEEDEDFLEEEDMEDNNEFVDADDEWSLLGQTGDSFWWDNFLVFWISQDLWVDDMVSDPTREELYRKFYISEGVTVKKRPEWDQAYLSYQWLVDYWGLSPYNIPAGHIIDEDDSWGGANENDIYTENYLKWYYNGMVEGWGYGMDEYDFYGTPIRAHQHNQLVLEIHEAIFILLKAFKWWSIILLIILVDSLHSTATMVLSDYWHLLI